MGKAFTSSMLHFLDDKGNMLNPMPIKSKKLVENLQLIIRFINNEPHRVAPSPPLICWDSPKKKRCLGKIDASIDLQNNHIVWHCLKCGNHGMITQWKNTIFDVQTRGG